MQELKELEQSDQYIFHGTSNGDIEIFEPRQAMSHGKKDGEPCVAASEHIDPAIFMAIFSGRVSCGWNSDGTNFGFYLSKNDYQRAKTERWNGYVYVFGKEKFNPYMGWEWRVHEKVKPVKKIKVEFSDLPQDIRLT